jgi:hypothetical protein
VSVAHQVNPERHPFLANRAYYWAHHGRALTRVRRRQDDAVVALRTAEDVFPAKVLRDPMVRDAIESPGDRCPLLGARRSARFHQPGVHQT